VQTAVARRRLGLPSGKTLLVCAGLVVSAVFTYLAVRGVHFHEVWQGLTDSNYWWLLPAVALVGVASVLRSYRWAFLLARETRPPIPAVLAAVLLGQFFNNILPARAGEAARIVALNQTAGTSRAEALATVVLERAYDVLALLVLLFVTLPWLPHVTWLRAAAILAIVVVVCLLAVLAVVAMHGERPVRFLLRPFARLPFATTERTDLAAASLVRGLAGLRRPGLAAASFALTVVSWLVLGLAAWLVMRGFHLHLPFLAGVLVNIAMGLAMILPASPAAIGVFEAAVLVALNAYGVPHAAALSYALVFHALNFFPYIAAGLVLMQAHALRLRHRPA
jgi:uncharacterized membrane protein YbhN (UPF0104 family)